MLLYFGSFREKFLHFTEKLHFSNTTKLSTAVTECAKPEAKSDFCAEEKTFRKIFSVSAFGDISS
jgi:hypothetical protein